MLWECRANNKPLTTNADSTLSLLFRAGMQKALSWRLGNSQCVRALAAWMNARHAVTTVMDNDSLVREQSNSITVHAVHFQCIYQWFCFWILDFDAHVHIRRLLLFSYPFTNLFQSGLLSCVHKHHHHGEAFKVNYKTVMLVVLQRFSVETIERKWWIWFKIPQKSFRHQLNLIKIIRVDFSLITYWNSISHNE